MNIAFRKIARDLWHHKARTALVVLSIAVGVMAVGMTVSAQTLVARQLARAKETTQFAHVGLALSQPVSDEMVSVLADLSGVAKADGSALFGLRWKPAPEAEWQETGVWALADFAHQPFNFIQLRQGNWPDEGAVAVDGAYVTKFHLPPVGGTIYFEVNDRALPVTLGGTVRDPDQLVILATAPIFYATREMLAQLGGPRDFDHVRLMLRDFTRARAEAVASAAEAKLSKVNVQVVSVTIQDPRQHPAQESFNAFLLILGVMGVASLGLSVFLVVNTISALVAGQTNQIGIMKAIGGTSSQIATLYLSGAVAYGLLSLLLALPLGAWGGMLLTNFLLTGLNVPETAFAFVGVAALYQFGAGLLTPLLAALWPVWQGTRITVRQAIVSYGLGRGHYGTGLIDKLLGRVRGLPRLATLALRNTFRRAGRAALTELTLIVAGAVFMMVASTQTSFDYTIAQTVGMWGFDAQIFLDKPYRIEKIEAFLRARPEVTAVEMWAAYTARVSVPGEKDINRRYQLSLTAIPPDTQMFTPRLTAGRNLQPGDNHALLLNQKLAKDLGVTVGDKVELDYGAAGKALWTVVGLIIDISNLQQTGYVYLDPLSADVGGVRRASLALVHLQPPTEAAQESFANAIRADLDAQGVKVTTILTILKFKREATGMFAPIAGLLMVMAVLIAVVGSFSLSGTLSINVLERTREIGVLRAVGASSLDVALIFMGEGLLLGLISWAVALPLGLVGAPAFLNAISVAFSFPMEYAYAPTGALIWLGIVIGLSLLASWLPARRATQISVRESLAYE